MFRAWYEAHFGYVWKSLARLGVPEHERRDLTQDVFAVVFRQLARFDPRRPVKPWLFGITFRTALDFRRRRTLSTEPYTGERHGLGSTSVVHDLDESIAHRQGLALIDKFLATLSDEQRAVFVLHDIDGVTVPDIAHALEVPLNTAYSRLRLARGAFEAFVARERARSRGGAHV